MRRWLRAVRVAARIARRDARRARARTALVVALVGLPIFAGTAGGILISSLDPTDATYARQMLGQEGAGTEEIQARVSEFVGPDLVQSLRGDAMSWSGETLRPPTVAEYEQAVTAQLPAGNRLLRAVEAAGALSTPTRAVTSVTVLGLPADGDLSAVLAVDDGALPGTADELALSPDAVERLGVGLGDVVTVEVGEGETTSLTVTGVLARQPQVRDAVVGPGMLDVPDVAGEDPTSGASRRSWLEWYVIGPEPVTWQHVLALNETGSRVTSRAVLTDPPPPEEVPYGAGDPGGPDSGTIALVGGIAAVILIEAVLLIGPAFAVGARRSERELALLAASGAERRALRHVVLFAGVVTGLVASVVGVVLGVLTAVVVRAVVHAVVAPFTFADLRVPWLAIVGAAVLGTLIATVAAWLPARRAARVDVVAALAGRRPSVRHGRRLAVGGGIVAVVGLAAAVAGAVLTEPFVLVGGIVALELGVVAAAGTLVGITARLAPRLGVAGRLALRDAARNRSRTAPAVAAVLAGVAGITAGAVYFQSGQEYNARQYAPFAAEGSVAVEVPAADTVDANELEERLDEAAAVLADHVPVTEVHRVSLAIPAETPDGEVPWVGTRTPPENLCPLWDTDTTALSRSERRTLGSDERCHQSSGSGSLAWTAGTGWPLIVDDGTVIGALGLERAAEAAQVLAAGRAVVVSEYDLQADGTVLAVVEYEAEQGKPVTAREARLPAEVVPLAGLQYRFVIPPEALDELGLRAQPAGLLAAVSRPPTPAEEGALTAALGSDVDVHVEPGNPYGGPGLQLLLLVVAAVVVGLAATGISVVLAAAESRPDLATLAAVGAEPRTRRRFAAAQAGVISGLGTALGAVAGLVLGWVLVTSQRYRWDIPDPDWQVSVPWVAVGAIAVGVPLLAAAVGFLAARSRLPVVRRLAA